MTEMLTVVAKPLTGVATSLTGVCYEIAGFVSCLVEGLSLSCDFYGITQRRPVYSIQVYA